MSENTRICQTCCTPPQVALTEYQYNTNIRNQTEYIYASTITSIQGKPIQYKSQTERIQALQGKISLRQCGS